MGRHYFGADGAMATGFTQLKDGRPFITTLRANAHGEQPINGQWYLFDTDGHMYSGWKTLKDGRTVYYDVDAKGVGRGMLHGIQLSMKRARM